MKLKSLNNTGIAHLIALVAVVVITAAVGTFLLVSSKAATPTAAENAPVASAASKKFNCPSNVPKPVNASTKDFMQGGALNDDAWNALNKTGYGIICVKNPQGRKSAKTVNKNTITAIRSCENGKVFAFDRKNPDGTGYDESPWVVQTTSFKGNKKYGKKVTLYCINAKSMYSNDSTGFAGQGHTYAWVPMVDLYKGCPAKEKKYTACTNNWFFTYAGSGDSFKAPGRYYAN